MTKLSWDLGTAYDFFISMQVLQNPAKFGLRGSWAAGVRSRIPQNERKMIEEAEDLFWIPIHWIYAFDSTKDAQTVLHELNQIPPQDRLVKLALRPSTSPEAKKVLLEVRESKRWTTKDAERLKESLFLPGKSPRQKVLSIILDAWANAAETGERYLEALQAYYDVFFAEEERRIRPALEKSLQEAQALSSEKIETEQLIEILSQGVHFEPPLYHPEADLVLVPSFWISPLVIYEQFGANQWGLIFGGRPPEYSLVPGEMVPDAMLQALKALADPTRLRILRYLSAKPMTPSLLARKLRLRAPTVVHHLSELRLAGLVHLTVDTPEKKSERRYTARLEAIPRVCASLEEFLAQRDDEVVNEAFEKTR